jgi:putative polyhydroxyalkanoate system protein
MATIDISRAHTLTLDEAKKRAEELAKGMVERFAIQWRWSGDSILFEAPGGAAKGTKGEVNVTDKNVRVQIDLPFMLRVMKGTIEDKVREKLAKLV